jgi:predicted amidohydrolase YtcJ
MAPVADIIFTNAKIFTSDESRPHAEAIAVKANRIVYVGDDEGAEQYRGEKTRVIDGQGHTLAPGFIDTHVHLLWGSVWMGNAQLQEVQTKEDLKNVLLEFAEKTKIEPWVVGRGIKYSIVSTRQELDEIIADRPIYIGAFDGHTGWANTKALEMAGILGDDGREMPNGIIVRDENGVASGELRESDAMDTVMGRVPLPDEARKRELLQLAIHEFNKTGITSVHNMNGDMEELMAYAALEDAGEMHMRVYVPYHVKPETKEEELREAAEMAKVQMDYVRGGAAKFFMDGVWESYTAFNLQPYSDDPSVGQVPPIFTLDHFTRMASACDKMGLQIAVHCCGDGAVRQALDGYEAIQKANGKRDSRHRVEHIEVCQPEDMPRFKELGVIASMQTSHAPFSVEEDKVWTGRTGPERWPHSFAWRALKNAGAHLSLGSDWTVAPFDPMFNIYVALNRTPLGDSPDQRLTLEECILGYTRDAAYVEFKEHEKGQIKEGYLADLVLFSHDLFEVKPEEIRTAKPVLTLFDGQIVFEA